MTRSSSADAAAQEYVEHCGASFWEETEAHLREITKTVETKLGFSAALRANVASLSASGANSEIDAQRTEVVHRLQFVINNQQLGKLTRVIKHLDGQLTDPQKPIYIVIDHLDDAHIEEQLKSKLIVALLEAVKDLREIGNAKVIVALRTDLLEKALEECKPAGFQEEKYHALFLPLNWTKSQLKTIVDLRVDYMVQGRHRKQVVYAKDILPPTIGNKPVMDYMLERTLYRPRDIIAFINECLAVATDMPTITQENLKCAEYSYSSGRLRAYYDEWFLTYPALRPLVELLLRKRPIRCTAMLLTDDEISYACLEVAASESGHPDVLTMAATKVATDEMKPETFRSLFLSVLYHIGIVGLKPESYEGLAWASGTRPIIVPNEIAGQTAVQIHPSLWRALGATGSDSLVAGRERTTDSVDRGPRRQLKSPRKSHRSAAQ